MLYIALIIDGTPHWHLWSPLFEANSHSSSSRTVLLDDADPTRFDSLRCVSTSFTRRTYAYPTLWWDIMSWARLFSARFVFPDWRRRRRRSRKRSRNKIVFPEHKREVAETKIRTHDLIHDLENISALDRSTTVGRLIISVYHCFTITSTSL